MKDGYRVAVVGATGAVGMEMVKVLEQRNFPVSSLRVLASARSIGKTVEFRGETLKVGNSRRTRSRVRRSPSSRPAAP